MRKFITVFLSVIIILTISAPIISSAQDIDTLRFTVISDVHYKYDSILEDDSKNATDNSPLYFRGGITGQMDYESNAVVNSFIKDFSQTDSEILLVTGDITDGKKENHIGIAEKFKDIEHTGKKVFVINGNHDITSPDDTSHTSSEDFKRIYADFGYNEALSVDESSLSYTAKLNAGYRLLAIDSCIYGADKGKITDSTFEWIKNEISKAKSDNVQLIAMMHHSLLSHLSVYSLTGMSADGSDELAILLADNGIKMVFTGHFHANDITAAQRGKNEIYDIMTGSLITYPNAFRNITIENNSAKITTDYVKSVDISGLPPCFSVKEKSAISTDFSAYAKGFLYYGIENWINRYLGSAQKVCNVLKIDRNSAVGIKLDEIMPNISKALTMPIYGENSLQTVASLADYTIPESKYNSLAEIASEIMCSIYCGDEKIGKNSTEFKILLAGLHSALAYAGCGIAGNLTPNSLTDASKLTHSFVFADEFILTYLSPIFDGITSDAYEPHDLNITIEFNKNNNYEFYSPLTFFQKLIMFLQKLFAIFV